MKKKTSVVLGTTLFLVIAGCLLGLILVKKKSKEDLAKAATVAATTNPTATSCMINATDLDPIYDLATCHLSDGRVLKIGEAGYETCFGPYQNSAPLKASTVAESSTSYFTIASGSTDQCAAHRVVSQEGTGPSPPKATESRFTSCRGYAPLQNTTIVRWSDANSWGGAVPEPGAHVVIPEGKIVLLDISPPPLASLKIYGALIFDQVDADLTVGSMIFYGVLQVGSPKSPYRRKANIKLNDHMRKLTPHDQGLLVQGGRMALSGVREPGDNSPPKFQWGYTTYPNINLENEKTKPKGFRLKGNSENRTANPATQLNPPRAQVFWYKKDRARYGGDFILQNNKGPWRFTEQAREVNLMYVGYAKCPDVCPLTLSFISQAYSKLSDEEKKRIGVLFLSVDKAHDQPESVQKFVDNFSTDFVGLTGSQEEIDTAVDLVGASYNITKVPTSRLGYSIGHSDRVFLLDKKGAVLRTEAGVRSSETVLKLMRGNYGL